ncbi:hypothetical protein HOO65_050247 [Ceratocystis lukuohia]|uniref:Uncharacterized protein n=1 Tax=Ceratocystis lukuohia TaxID=2019550 RepID=A0ABR4MFR9_9PEZI
MAPPSSLPPPTCESLFDSESDSDASSAAYDSGSSRSSSECTNRLGSENVSPSTNLCSRSSAETFASTVASSVEDDCTHTAQVFSRDSDPDPDYEIARLDPYTHEITDPTVRPSNPADFARLFPSMNRLFICHDDFTNDGNMNLRVTTDATYRNRRISMQLFHLRMYDLARRDFSLRRYCRDSGREICSTKRQYVQRPATEAKPSMTSVLKKNFSLRRSHPSHPASANHSRNSSPSPKIAHNIAHDPVAHIPLCCGTAGSDASQGSSQASSSRSTTSSISEFSASASALLAQPQRPLATDTIKLEFSNYARVDVTRCNARNALGYSFDWWGNSYSWHRVTDEQNMPGVVSFHLYRNSEPAPLAHLVPETRSPNQVAADENANGWIPPCHMWISDNAILSELTDHADVIVATGLVSLVDDCIRAKWQKKKPVQKPRHRMSLLLNPSSPLSLSHSRNRTQSLNSENCEPHADEGGTANRAQNLSLWGAPSPAPIPIHTPKLQKVLPRLHLRMPFHRRPSVTKTSSPLRFISPLPTTVQY